MRKAEAMEAWAEAETHAHVVTERLGSKARYTKKAQRGAAFQALRDLFGPSTLRNRLAAVNALKRHTDGALDLDPRSVMFAGPDELMAVCCSAVACQR
jgi:hypothetical protein